MTPDEATLREQYARFGTWMPFEHTAARFRVDDLAYLLEGGDRLRLTYLIDESAEPWRGEELREWVATGVISMVARKAMSAGHTPVSLNSAAEEARRLDDTRSLDTWRKALASIPNAAEYVRDCARAGLGVEWLDAGLRTGASVEALVALRSLGVPHRYPERGIVGAAGDAVGVQSWYVVGISPGAAARFAAAGITPGSAITWLREGYLPEEAIAFAQKGLSHDAASPRADKPAFSTAFRRTGEGIYSMKGAFAERVDRAVQALDVPPTWGLSNARWAWQVAFLDGGYVNAGGSHPYSCVLGDAAVRLVCHRVGVRPPKTRRGEAPGASMAALEEMLQDQRLNHWDDLSRQGRAR